MLSKINFVTLLAPLLIFFAPVQEILLMMMVLVFADTASGIWKCKKLGIKITSFGLSALVSKLFVYCGAILLVYSVDQILINDFLKTIFSVDHTVTKFVALVFSFIELKSIDENYVAVKGYGFWEKAKQLIASLKVVKSEYDGIKKEQNK
jgi:hypothetical protein